MARKPRTRINEASLSKGQLRKLNALRKSLGGNIADKAFAQWLSTQDDGVAAPQVDKNAQLVAQTLSALANDKGLRIPRGGYLLSRGRGRVIVTRMGNDA